MWIPTTQRQHSRIGLRYETDLTDAEWAVVEPLLPEPASCGRPTLWPMREILNGIFYVLRGGIAWRLLPKDLPPKSTVFGYFSRWRDAGVFLRIHHRLVMSDRERVGCDASGSAYRLGLSVRRHLPESRQGCRPRAAALHDRSHERAPDRDQPGRGPRRPCHLNPAENIWQYMRENWLSNRIFESYEEILDICCEAWNRLAALPEAITSIGMRPWANPS